MIFGFSKMRAVATRYNDRPAAASRPFDRGRDGFVLGEGAWMLVLEREDRARARAARDLRHDRRLRIDLRRLSPRADGSRRRADRAARCGWRSSAPGGALEEIGYVNYHGTSTVLNDAVEARCVRRCSAHRADRVPGSSTKSMIGHPQGASGAAGIVTAALALRDGFLPPTINLDDPDPECDLDHPRTPARRGAAGALCNCLGFGSKNSAIVLGGTVTDDVLIARDDSWTLIVVGGDRPASPRSCSRAPARGRLLDRATFPRQAVRRHAQSRRLAVLARLGLDPATTAADSRHDRHRAGRRAARG